MNTMKEIEDHICAGIQTLPIRDWRRMYLSIHTAQERILSVSLENPTYRVETPANAKETDLLTFLLHITNLLLIESEGFTSCWHQWEGKGVTVEFTIKLKPITKKNSQQIVTGKNGRPFIIPSAAYKKYEKACKPFMPKVAEPIDYPVNVKAVFYMQTKRKVDLTNLHEALHDILVKYGVLEDDNFKIIQSTDGSRVSYDKWNPRTEVEITRAGDDIECD